MKGKKLIYTLPVIGVVCILVGLVVGITVGAKRGIPFVTEKEQWTIGIYSGESPFELTNELGFRNPVLKAEDVTDVPAKFVADPFLIRDDSTWYLFFEVYNLNSEQGDLAVATSTDAKNWEYQQVIIDEPFHLSYPYVFNHDGDYYLIPESYQSNSIRLYKAIDFPNEWEFVSTLVDDVSLVDPSIVNFNDRWWIFSSEESKENDTLRLYYADELTGPWQEHPIKPNC
jgi:beta-xylosidase